MRYLTPVFILLLTTSQSPAERTAQDDAAVYDAVIEHTLRDSFQSYAGASARGTRATVYVVGRTVPACDAANDPNLGCVARSDVGRALTIGVERIPRAHIPSPEATVELTADFRSRNRTSHDLPTLPSEAVAVLTDTQLHEVSQRVRNGERANYASFTLPAYSRDGHAVVYVTYVCGNLCGNWWLFLLEKVDSKWHVQERRLLGIA